MRATFTEEQIQLQQVVADIARDGRPDAPAPHDRVPGARQATDALLSGFAGLGVPEDAGGVGGELVDLAIVCHELGRHVVPTPFVPHVMAVQAAWTAGLDVQAAARGDATWTLASDEPGASPYGPWEASLDPVGGMKPRVPYADDASAVVATAGSDGVAVVRRFAVGDEGAGVLDLTRPAGTVALQADGADTASEGAAAGLARAVPLLAAELVGVGRGAVDLATEYAQQREQFGAPIGRFQAVAHQIADALVAVEEAWSLVLYAAWAVDAGDAGAGRAVHVAKAAASEAAVFAAERCTQVHGGIGITWEAMPHLFLRRAVSDATWLGDAGWHRRRAGGDVRAGGWGGRDAGRRQIAGVITTGSSPSSRKASTSS